MVFIPSIFILHINYLKDGIVLDILRYTFKTLNKNKILYPIIQTI